MSGTDPSVRDRTPDRSARPNALPWPPMIFGAVAVAAVVLNLYVPIAHVLPRGPAPQIAGGAGMLLGLGLDLSAMVTMWRHKANILPHRAATALVTTGPFALTRNPIYLGNTLLLAGAALALNNVWLLLGILVAVPLVTRLAIRREEAHLAARFGDAWKHYARRTPRWLRILI